jgi:hypothetical protein
MMARRGLIPCVGVWMLASSSCFGSVRLVLESRSCSSLVFELGNDESRCVCVWGGCRCLGCLLGTLPVFLPCALCRF